MALSDGLGLFRMNLAISKCGLENILQNQLRYASSLIKCSVTYDEGKGSTIVFVHGKPSWSYEFRYLIKELSKQFWCIAVDHLGFGLSDKPSDFSYLPAEHAKNLESFIQHLGLENITLYVGDWGGPIGLSYAVNYPDNISNFVITNHGHGPWKMTCTIGCSVYLLVVLLEDGWFERGISSQGIFWRNDRHEK